MNSKRKDQTMAAQRRLLGMMSGAAMVVLLAAGAGAGDRVLLEDDFSGLPSGPLGSVVGAHTEYHFFPEAAPKGEWAVSCFSSDTHSQRAWRAQADRGQPVVAQTFFNRKDYKYFHPMIIAGDDLWRDYEFTVRFAPQMRDEERQCGVVFRYQNDRCYYFFGLRGSQAILKMVRHASAYHQPLEKRLASAPCDWEVDEYLEATVAVEGSRIRCQLSNGVALEAEDSTYADGKIGLTSDVPVFYQQARVVTSEAEHDSYLRRKAERARELARLQANNPRPVVWKKIDTSGFGMGRNLRFGDLDGDGQIDVLIGQVVHHGPKDRYSELSCLTAMTFDGKILWRKGDPDAWKDHLTNDVGFQIHDLDGDGRNEVVYCMDFQIIVADGATGRTRYKAPTPPTRRVDARYPRILGDSLFFCDLQGKGRPSNIIIKDRYWQLWALNQRLEIMWRAECTTGHYPYAYDIDGDGKDEVAIGYSLLDDDGRKLWSRDDEIKDHADGVAIVRFRKDQPLRLLNAASDEGMILFDLDGDIVTHLHLGHVQNPAVANFRDDLPGLEIVSINFWRNQGILHFYDADGKVYHECEPNQFGSMCLPVNWTGKSEEYFVHSPNVEEGGMFDGWGRPVVLFPNDGHPDMCNAVMDVTGDCRDEVVVWDPYELWVYTQEDNPKSGRLYRPTRNPLYNYSNYQASVSLPGWSSTSESAGTR